MDNVTLKDILGIEEIDFEILVDIYNRLPNAEKYWRSGRGYIIEIPVPDTNPILVHPCDDIMPVDTTIYHVVRFEIEFGKGVPYWFPIKKVYIETK